jgi:(p)ppGpp synthase/HD superfamily hydrolase
MLEAAARLAARGHYRQFRKRLPDDGSCLAGDAETLPADCIPYITHLMGTMGILAKMGASDVVLAAALLHDYLEDVPDPDGPETIRRTVGQEVLDLVLEVTEVKRPDQDDITTWQLRKSEQLEKMAVMSTDALLIKTADLLHNLLSMLADFESATEDKAVWARLNAGPERQLWYFTTALDAAGNRLGDHPLAHDLQRAVTRLRERLPADHE